MSLTLVEELAPYIWANCSGIWLRTREPFDAERQIYALCHAQQHLFMAWDPEAGQREHCYPGAGVRKKVSLPACVAAALGSRDPARPDQHVILVIHMGHKFLGMPEVLQCLMNAVEIGKTINVHFVILAPHCAVPEELQTYINLVHDKLPDAEEIKAIFNSTLGREPQADVSRAMLEALGGLTRFEVENELSLATERNDRVTPREIWGAKAKALEKSKLLQLYRGGETFSDVCGMTQVKDFVSKCLRPDRKRTPKGIMMLGVSGCGKSLFARAVGNQMGRVTLRLDVGSLLNSLVGQSESNLRIALEIAEAMSPCILWADELEKALAGVGSNNDSGVMTRLFGHLLTWRQDTEADVYLIATANNVESIPYEFLRPGRFDATFFADLPNEEEREAIWRYHVVKQGVAEEFGGMIMPNASGWTGAEIEHCCVLAATLGMDLEDAAKITPTVSKRAPEAIQKVRNFAAGWALSANEPGFYQAPGFMNMAAGHQTFRNLNRKNVQQQEENEEENTESEEI